MTISQGGGVALKIVMNWDLCESNFVCHDSCPDLFLIDEENDKLIIAKELVPVEFETDVADAERRCPKGAISLLVG